MKSNILDWLKDAHQKGYAVPAFDFSTVWEAAAILQAAQEERSPVIIMALQPFVDGIGGYAAAGGIGRALVDSAAVPAMLHLDHCHELERCKAAVDAGFDSVMFDASLDSLEENIRGTAQVVEYAHAHGVYVEAEIGKIKGRSVEMQYEGGDFLAQVEDAAALVEQGGPDFLAVGIGTQHGFYTAPPKLNFQRLGEIDASLQMPLVMHGGTGVPEEDVRRAVQGGISKVNVGTDILTHYSNALRAELWQHGENTTVFQVNQKAMDAVKEVARRWIKVCMSDQKAR